MEETKKVKKPNKTRVLSDLFASFTKYEHTKYMNLYNIGFYTLKELILNGFLYRRGAYFSYFCCFDAIYAHLFAIHALCLWCTKCRDLRVLGAKKK